MPYPLSMSWLYAEADSYPFTVNVIVDGTTIASYTLSKPASDLTWTITTPSGSGGPYTLVEPLMRLPPKKGLIWEIEITGAVDVKRVVVAQTMEEVKSE
jgi:hypothetical protein